MTRCPICSEPQPSRRIAAIYGLLVGLFVGAVVVVLLPLLLRAALHIPEPVPQSALTSCEEKLRDFAVVAGAAEAMERGRERR